VSGPDEATPPDARAPVAVLDHVAVAVERWADAWPRYVEELGGAWASGGVNVGFGPAQLRFGNGARLEVLQPCDWEANPFLRRFLDQHGPGPHHLTFKVPDIRQALARVSAAGFDPVGVDLRDPTWQEAFLHPRQAGGVVVQLAQSATEWASPPPKGFPRPATAPADLEHVTHVVADLGPALALFHDLLGGTVVADGDHAGDAWRSVDLAWTGPLRLRLVGPSDDGPSPAVERFLDGRPGHVHHLAMTVSDPAVVGDALRPGPVLGVAGPCPVVEPARNLGVRLVLRTPHQDPAGVG